MLTGIVNSRGEPVVRITLFSITNRIQSHLAVIDTGFNGTLSLPESLIQRLGWRCIGHESYEIATGDVVRERVFEGRVRWMRQIQDVDVVASHAKDVLIGTRLFEGRRLIIDFRKRHVRIS
jgi:clan AA aspartic protease